MLGDTGRVNFSHTLSPDPALSPAQAETPGDVTPAISPREVDFSCPEPSTGCWGLQVLPAWRQTWPERAPDSQHGQPTAPHLATPGNATKS